MKKLMMIMVALAMGLAQGAIQEVDGIKWWFKITGDGAEITSGSSSAAISTDTEGAITVPSVLGGKPVVSVGSYAFYCCTKLTSVTLPNCVTNVGDWAFNYCSSLESITLPSVAQIGVYAFHDCQNLKSITCPSVLKVGQYAFYFCQNLESISLPSVVDIQSAAFYYCTSLSRVFLSDQIRSVGSAAFSLTALWNNFADNALAVVDGRVALGYKGKCPSCVEISSGVKVIADYAFADLRELDSVSLPHGLDAIGAQAFSGTALMDISLPTTLKSIGDYSFRACGGLSEINLPSGLEYIGSGAFEGCDLLSSIVIPASVKTLGSYAFEDCLSLVSVTFEGDAPCSSYCSLYYNTPSDLTTYVPYGTGGWSNSHSSLLPSTWNSRAIVRYGTPSTHTVTFDANGGSLTGQNVFTYTDGDAIQAPYPSRPIGYFDGWYDQAKGGNYVASGGTFYPAGDMVLYAHWGNYGDEDDPEDLHYAYDRTTGYSWSFLVTDGGVAELYGVEPEPEGVLRFPSTVTDLESGVTYTVVSIGHDDKGGSYCNSCCDPGLDNYTSGFKSLERLTGVIVPETVEILGRDAFRGCANLTSVTLSSSVREIRSGAFSHTGLTAFTVPASVTVFSLSAFSYCEHLELLTVEARTVGSDCSLDIYGCPMLVTLNLPKVIESIDEDWGYEIDMGELPALTSLTFPEGVTSVWFDSEDERGLPQLSSVFFPSTLQYFDDDVFNNCWALDKVVFAGDVIGNDWDGGSGITCLMTALAYANSVYYSSTYAEHWRKVLRNLGYGGTHGTFVPEKMSLMKAVVMAAPKYAAAGTPDFGPYVVGIEGTQTAESCAGYEMTGSIPVGLSWNKAAGTLSGTAAESGVFTVYVNGSAMSVRVDPAPTGLPDETGSGDVPTLVDETETHVDVGRGEVAPYETAAAVYDGYLYDANGGIAGTVQVKVAKMKNGEAKVTATVQLADGSKKLSFKNGVADAAGNVTGMSAGGHALAISLGVNGMGGSMDGNSVDGARNLFSSKSKEEKDTADAIANDCIGTYNIAGEDGVLTVTVAKKGKAKVSGTWKGAKVSVSSQLLIGESACVVPVVFAKKGVSLAFNLNIFGANDVTVTGLSVNAVGKPGVLRGGAKFGMGDGAPRLAAALADKGTLQTAYLPGCPVAQNGTKWVVAGGAKAGKLALLKGTSDIDPAKSKFTDNMSGLKLTYKAKDGSFKGSFKAYNLENGKLKSYTVNVTGVMVGDTGYGTATLKKPAVSWPITIE